MAAKFIVRFTPAAGKDLLSIFDYIEQENPERASAYMGSILKRIDTLAQLPSLGRESSLKRLQKKGYRILVIDDYLVYYVVKK